VVPLYGPHAGDAVVHRLNLHELVTYDTSITEPGDVSHDAALSEGFDLCDDRVVAVQGAKIDP